MILLPRRKDIWLNRMMLFVLAAFIIIGNSASVMIPAVGFLRLSEVLMGAACVLFVLFSPRRKTVFKIFGTPAGWLVLWAIYGAIVCVAYGLNSHYENSEIIHGLAYGVRVLIIAFFARCFVVSFRYAGWGVERLGDFVIVCFAIVCFVGFFQLIFYPIAADFYDLLRSFGFSPTTEDPHIRRLLSTYLDPNYLSSILILPLAFCLRAIDRPGGKKLFYWFNALLLLVTILLTSSRSGFLAASIVLFAFLLINWFKRRSSVVWNYIFFGVIAAAIGVLLFGNIRVIERVLAGLSDPSSQARFQSWQTGLDIFVQNPIFGIGYNLIGTYRAAMGEAESLYTLANNDSSLILVMSTTGIIGTIFFVLFFVKSMFRARKEPIFIFFYIACFLVSNFNQLLLYPLFLLWFLVVPEVLRDSARRTVMRKKLAAAIYENFVLPRQTALAVSEEAL